MDIFKCERGGCRSNRPRDKQWCRNGDGDSHYERSERKSCSNRSLTDSAFGPVHRTSDAESRRLNEGSPNETTRFGDQMSALRFLTGLSILASLWAIPLLAQDDHRDPIPPARGVHSNIAVGVGYSYLNMNVSGKPPVNLHGIDTNAVID